MDELVAVVARAEQVERPIAPHPLEEDLEDAEPTVPEELTWRVCRPFLAFREAQKNANTIETLMK